MGISSISGGTGFLPGIGAASVQRDAGLAAQLASYEKQLAELKSCPSCRTPEGLQAVSALSNRIAAIRQRIEQAERTPAAAVGNRSETVLQPAGVNGPEAGRRADSATGPGGIIDTYA